MECQLTGWMDKMRVIVVRTHNSLQQLMCRTDLNFMQQTVSRVVTEIMQQKKKDID